MSVELRLSLLNTHHCRFCPPEPQGIPCIHLVRDGPSDVEDQHGGASWDASGELMSPVLSSSFVGVDVGTLLHVTYPPQSGILFSVLLVHVVANAALNHKHVC